MFHQDFVTIFLLSFDIHAAKCLRMPYTLGTIRLLLLTLTTIKFTFKLLAVIKLPAMRYKITVVVVTIIMSK